jgi:drug/metabolite transporter (DMT)-like permease
MTSTQPEVHPPSRRSNRAWFFLLLALACLIWAGQGTAVKFLNRHLGPIAITFLPFYVATVLLLPVLAARFRHNSRARRPSWSDWRKFVTAGIAGQILAQLAPCWRRCCCASA